MAITEILFNDFLSEDTHSLTARVGGEVVAGTKMLDGDVSTCVPGANQIICTARSANAPRWNAMGLINLPPSPAVITPHRTLPDGRLLHFGTSFMSGGGNYLLYSGDLGRNVHGQGFRLTSTLNSLCPAEIYLGVLERIEVYYPQGWRPPMIHPTEDDILLSENSLPNGRFIKQKAFETEIPFTFRHSPEELNSVIKRMQRSSFLWRWRENAPLLYCWATDIGQWRYRSPNVLDVVVKISGFFEYQNIGSESPGGSFSGVPGGGSIPGIGGAGDIIGRHPAWGYDIRLGAYDFAPGATYAEIINPRGERQQVFTTSPVSSGIFAGTLPTADLRAPTSGEVLDDRVVLWAAAARVVTGGERTPLVPYTRPPRMIIG